MGQDIPNLSPGIGFHLQPDGSWKAEKIPQEALDTAKFSGYLTIMGYRCSVFDSKDSSQWAQKSTGTPAEPPTTASKIAEQWLRGHNARLPETDDMRDLVTSRVLDHPDAHRQTVASRIAARWLQSQGDVTSLVQKKLDRSGEDKDYDKAIVDFVTKSRNKLPPIDAALSKACDILLNTRDKIEHKHPKVQDRYVQKFLQELAQKHRELEDIRKQLMRALTVELDGYESEANVDHIADFASMRVHARMASEDPQSIRSRAENAEREASKWHQGSGTQAGKCLALMETHLEAAEKGGDDAAKHLEAAILWADAAEAEASHLQGTGGEWIETDEWTKTISGQANEKAEVASQALGIDPSGY